MTSDRVYRKALPWYRVRAELIRGSGSQWHAQVADTLVAMVEEERAAAAATRSPESTNAVALTGVRIRR